MLQVWLDAKKSVSSQLRGQLLVDASNGFRAFVYRSEIY